MKWPEQVPVLKPEDFVIGPPRRDDRLCLITWRDQVFRGVPWIELGPSLWDSAAKDQHVLRLDTPDTPVNRRIAARIWATFIDRLGYTEDGPIVDL